MIRLASACLIIALSTAGPAAAQSPFYTDDAATTSKGRFHFELFNEFDVLQHDLYPSIRQNTTNMKLNYGITDTIEFDLDSPYLTIFRTRLILPNRLNGVGDADLGVKWNFHKESPDSRVPALAASFYVEFPTGDTNKQLGSGLVDYALNTMYQKTLADRTKITFNVGLIFAGNNSTGLIGLQTHDRVYTGGTSLARQFTKRLTLGVEWNGAISRNFDLGRSQLQFLGGGSYEAHKGFLLTFAVLGGLYVGSPLAGAQVGFTIDFPAIRASSFSTAKKVPEAYRYVDLIR